MLKRTTNRGNAKAELGRHEEAIADYDEAIELNPENALAYNNRGNAKANLGRHEEAIADYDRAIGINPEYALAYANRGRAKSALGHVSEAEADSERALELADQQGDSNLKLRIEQMLGDLNGAE